MESVLKKDGNTLDQTVKLFKDNFRPILKTLEELMLLENVRKKLENKRIIVKIVDKSEKIVSFTSGFIKNSVVINGDGTTTKHWNFIVDNNIQKYVKNNLSSQKR